MFGKCLLASLAILGTSYSSSDMLSAMPPKPLVKLVLQGLCRSPSCQGIQMEKYTLELPKGIIQQSDVETFFEIFVMYPDSLGEFLKTYQSKSGLTHMEEEGMSLAKQIVIGFDNTIAQLEKVLKVETVGLETLPQESKSLLLDIASILVEKGQTKYTAIVDLLHKADVTGIFDKDFKLLNSGYALRPSEYKRYYTPLHLTALARCFAVTKVLEELGANFHTDSGSFETMLTRTVDQITEESDELAQLFNMLGEKFKSLQG